VFFLLYAAVLKLGSGFLVVHQKYLKWKFLVNRS